MSFQNSEFPIEKPKCQTLNKNRQRSFKSEKWQGLKWASCSNHVTQWTTEWLHSDSLNGAEISPVNQHWFFHNTESVRAAPLTQSEHPAVAPHKAPAWRRRFRGLSSRVTVVTVCVRGFTYSNAFRANSMFRKSLIHNLLARSFVCSKARECGCVFTFVCSGE